MALTYFDVTKLPTDPGPAAWDAILPEGKRYPALEGINSADWLVIGAGFTGLAAARQLCQLRPNEKIVLLDARRIAEGPVGRNSGFMIDLPHNLVSEDYAGSLETDRKQASMNRLAIDFALAAAEEYAMPADAVLRSGKVNAAATAKGTRHNHAYAAHLARMDEAHELLDASQMKAICGSDYYESGLYTPGTAMLQPALYARCMADGLLKHSVTVCENSPVLSLVRKDNVWTATTSQGSISAPKVILCVNGHAQSFGLFKGRLMHIYLYASVTRTLTSAEEKQLGGNAIWGFTPADPMGTTVRKIRGFDGTRIVIRNRVTWAPSREETSMRVAEISKTHEHSFAARFPMLKNVTMEHRWGGLLCLSRNGASAFGEIDAGLYSACCQNGLGAARGTFSGMMAANLACDKRSDILDQFLSQPKPNRVPPEPFASIGATATMRWGEFKAGREL